MSEKPNLSRSATSWRKVLSSEEGSQVLRAILFKVCEMEKGTHEVGTDALTMAKLEGLREAGRRIRKQIEAAEPFGYCALLQRDIEEAQARAKGASS
jgi:hypothetical protein